jgi:pimeloyl-ACP methyl ester carboxylesterase
MYFDYFYPLFDERKCSHRFAFLLKTILEENGMELRRLEYQGTGEAAGEFSDVSFESLRSDVEGDLDDREDALRLVGLCFGASLCLDYVARFPGRVKHLVLIEPILDGAKYVDQLFRKQKLKDVMTGNEVGDQLKDGYFNLEGYKTSQKLIGELKEFNCFEIAEQVTGLESVVICQISDRIKVDAGMAKLADILRSGAGKVLLETVQFPRFWERISVKDYTPLLKKITNIFEAL